VIPGRGPNPRWEQKSRTRPEGLVPLKRLCLADSDYEHLKGFPLNLVASIKKIKCSNVDGVTLYEKHPSMNQAQRNSKNRIAKKTTRFLLGEKVEKAYF